MLKNFITYFSLKVDKLILFFCGLIFFSSVFQAAAIWNFTSFSLSPFYFLSVPFFILFVLSIFYKGIFITDKKLLLIWAAFFSVCMISMFFPLVFSGIPVLTARKGIDFGVINPTRLSFSISNLGQGIYIILNSSLFLFCLSDAAIRKRSVIIKFFVLSGWIVCFFAYYQFISWHFNLPYPYKILNYNTHYSQGYMQMLGHFKRVSSTFLEPSLAGACLVSFLSFYIFKVKPTLIHTGSVVLFFVATILTTSSTIVVGFLVIFLLLVFLKRKLWVIPVTFILILIATVFFPDYLSKVVVEKFSSISYIHRSLSNEISFKLLLDSYGLGVGLGSSRSSSFLFYLLSNVGVLGATAFIFLVFSVWSKYFFRFRLLDNNQMPVFASFTVYLACKIASVPDLNDPFFWVLLCLLCLFKPNVVSSRKTHVCNN